MTGNTINIKLSTDEALVLFEFLSRFNETRKLEIQDKSEERSLWNLQCSLEKELLEPFKKNYGSLLKEARNRLKDKK